MTVPIPNLNLTDAGTATSGINGAPVIQWGSPFAVGSAAQATADNQARATATGDPSSGNGGGAIGAGMPGGGGINWLAVAVAAGVVGIAYLASR
ncbi:hypothetical protein [Asticcacaulis sp.]|uniref:hypothetical protein n=1 Tax=Asticcacaulis sp. TaxID=1872648 RepID=UPI00261F1DBF|nr:hypothetical protein [Asticcacaulis sp.]